MRRLLIVAAAGACVALTWPAGGGAQSSLPPCDGATNGKLVKPELSDPEQRSGSAKLYATHRISAKLFATTDEYQAPDGSRYEVVPGSEHFRAGPAVLGSHTLLSASPGTASATVEWTVERSEFFGAVPEPYCTGSEALPFTLLKPARTSLFARHDFNDPTGYDPRVTMLIAGRPNDDLSPMTVRMRRGTRGPAHALFELELANVSPSAGGFRFKKRFAGVTVRTSATQANMETRGLVTLGVYLPRARNGRTLARNFTVELVRAGRVLMRAHASLSCRGHIVGIPPAFQECHSRAWRVTRP